MKLFSHLFLFIILFGCIFVNIIWGKKSIARDVKHAQEGEINKKTEALLSRLTLREKIGQMVQVNGQNGQIPDEFRTAILNGSIGSILNEVDVKTLNDIQRIAVEESRLGIPIIFARDVIHGFKTIFPIPLGLAATWNPELVEAGSRVAATEAATYGIRWTFAPMVDITRDPRWGRIAECLGEDPYLTSTLGAAMVRGFQGDDLSAPGSIAACAKHFAAYGAAEGGRDYNTASVPGNELRDVYLKPFKACVDAGAATLMAAFNEINGVPATGNKFLLNDVLRGEWGFKGFVVSDWSSVTQLITHGFSENEKEAACAAVKAGTDMEMASTTYQTYIEELVKEGRINEEDINQSVRRILTLKYQLGLFDNPYTEPAAFPAVLNDNHKALAKKAAIQSVVLLQNNKYILPLSKDIQKVAVIGSLADAPHDQLGTWIFDGHKKNSITPLQAITEFLGPSKVVFAKGLEISRTRDTKGFQQAVDAANVSDAILLFLGEESILSGESHCRADIGLPGAQQQLVETLAATGKPVVAIILAGRPLTIGSILEKVDAVLYAWHPGTMAGPAISDLIFGVEAPSGKLPVTFPLAVGQIPIYYSHKNTGKPATKESWQKMYDIPVEAFQLSIGNTSHYLDAGFEPLFPFGFGLSYTTFEYKNIKISAGQIKMNETVDISTEIKNTGQFTGEEVVQLYVRDLFADRTRPVRELKGFQRVRLEPGEQKTVTFTLGAKDLSFYNRKMQQVTEPGKFFVWIGGNSNADLKTEFEIIK
ncbi:beta-glucosidase BglX [candidate division KSB1 bacterium]|nr:beta-glucosidase BglX [candidate division KSB1 bacterium]